MTHDSMSDVLLNI